MPRGTCQDTHRKRAQNVTPRLNFYRGGKTTQVIGGGEMQCGAELRPVVVHAHLKGRECGHPCCTVDVSDPPLHCGVVAPSGDPDLLRVALGLGLGLGLGLELGLG